MAPNDFNEKIIAEFRANDGVVGGPFEGVPLLLLHHRGRQSGQARVTPLAYQKRDQAWAIFASYAGAPVHPAWYANLMAAPDTTIEVGAETVEVRAREAQGSERDSIWGAQKDAMPGFAEYEEKAGDRVIPVIVLERR
ncbi:MAG: nitroreductase family deazaflavin-dependent oxidoreductase [Acidobacteriota bacterium]|nr:nitroreductase family deazaflavin-dependent oxidoreductase [Acidobacteriota bacterium]